MVDFFTIENPNEYSNNGKRVRINCPIITAINPPQILKFI